MVRIRIFVTQVRVENRAKTKHPREAALGQHRWPQIRRARVDSVRILRGSDPESQTCEKSDLDVESYFIFGSSRILRALYACHILSKSVP